MAKIFRMWADLRVGGVEHPIPLAKTEADDFGPEVLEEVGLALAAERNFTSMVAYAQRLGSTARKQGVVVMEPMVTHETAQTTGLVSHRLRVVLGGPGLGLFEWSVPMGNALASRDSEGEANELDTIADAARAMLESALMQAHRSDTVLSIVSGLKSAEERPA